MTWAYIETESGLYTVGYYDANGDWEPRFDFEKESEAIARVNYLNGGPSDATGAGPMPWRLQIAAQIIAMRFDDVTDRGALEVADALITEHMKGAGHG